MNLQGRNLTTEMVGDDVMRLHSELRRLGHAVPEEEWRQATFGPGTREAVLAFQRAHYLSENGIVDARMAAELTQAVATVVARLPRIPVGSHRP